MDYAIPALLRAMAEKLIPGLPDSIKISLLQQTDELDDLQSESPDVSSLSLDPEKTEKARKKKTVLQTVLQSDQSRNEVTRKIQSMHH